MFAQPAPDCYANGVGTVPGIMKEFRPRTRVLIQLLIQLASTSNEELAQVVVVDTCPIFKQNFLPMDKRLTQLVRGIIMVMYNYTEVS